MTDGGRAGGPTAGWASGALGAVQAADLEIARQTAVRARAVAAFAATRPASADRPAGQPGSMSEQRRAGRSAVLAEVSEWAGQELVLALEISSEAAETLLERSLTLVHRLPRTLSALESGALHVGHLLPMLERVALIADDEKRGEVEARLLDWMAGRVTTPAQLAAKARRLGLLVDARDSARRLAEAVRERGVFARPDRRDGMAQAVALLTVPESAALIDALGRYADALDEPGDERTRGQKMADCLLDLVLRPGENGLAPVQAHLTVVAAVSTLVGGDEPGEIDGQVVPAEMVRALARALGLLSDSEEASGPVDEAAPSDDDGLTGDVAPTDDARPDAAAAGVTPVPQGVSLVERALEEWWSEVEKRVLFEERGGGQGAPAEEPRTCAGLTRWQAVEVPVRRPPDGGATRAVPPDAERRVAPALPRDATAQRPGPQRSVTAAGVALLEFDRALGRAGAAVRRAQIADAADEAAWLDSPAGRASAAADSIQALRDVGDEQRAALAGLLEATPGGTLAERPRVAVVDALTGALLALTDSRELRRTATCGQPACLRRPARCTHDLSGRPGLGPPPRARGTGRARRSTATSGHATGGAGSPAAADRYRVEGSWITTAPGRKARPARPTSPATARRTTGVSTRRRDGGTSLPPTAR